MTRRRRKWVPVAEVEDVVDPADYRHDELVTAADTDPYDKLAIAYELLREAAVALDGDAARDAHDSAVSSRDALRQHVDDVAGEVHDLDLLDGGVEA